MNARQKWRYFLEKTGSPSAASHSPLSTYLIISREIIEYLGKYQLLLYLGDGHYDTMWNPHTAISIWPIQLKEPKKHFLGIVLEKAQHFLVPAITGCHSNW